MKTALAWLIVISGAVAFVGYGVWAINELIKRSTSIPIDMWGQASLIFIVICAFVGIFVWALHRVLTR